MRTERLVLAVAIPLVASASFAAETRKRPGRYRVGPLYFSPRLELRNAGVDTNVLRARTRPVKDRSVLFRPSVTVFLPAGRRLRVDGEGFLDAQYFHREGSQRSLDFGLDGRARLDLGRITLFAGGGGLQVRQRFLPDLEPLVARQPFDLDHRLLRNEKWGSLGLRFDLSRRISATLAGNGRVYRTGALTLDGADVRESLDRNALSGSIQGRYALSRRTNLVASVEVLEDRFLAQSFGGSRIARSFRYLAGAEFGRRALLRGKVTAGIREFPGTVSQAAPSYRGPVLDVSTEVPLFGYARLGVTAERDVSYAAARVRVAGEEHRNTYVLSRYAASLLTALPFGLIGRGFAALDQGRYLLPVSQNGVTSRRVDHLFSAGGSVLRRLGERVRVGGNVSWGRRVSTIADFSYEEVVYGLQAEIVP
jgi:putative beta-barrel porin BBP2